MTSTRGQNVSILQLHSPSEPWNPPITTFTDSGGSLRSAPRTSSDKSLILNDKNFKQHSLESNSTAETLTKYKKKDFNLNKSISVLITDGLNSSATLNSGSRELSPVRWCDREVDGVYLGKSGWVQVQQRSLDERRRLSKNGDASTLPSRIKVSQYCNDEIDERGERHRPIYLPLASEKHKYRETAPLLVSVSPPSITPIISPPPAFKDSGLDLEFQMHSSKSRHLYGKPPALPRSRAIVDCDSPPKSPPEWDFPSRRLKSPFQYQPSHLPQTKSLDNASRNWQTKHSDSTLTLPLFGCHSLDSSFTHGPTVVRLNETDSSVLDYDDEECEYQGNVTISPSQERQNGVSPKFFQYRNGSRNGRQTPSSDSSYKKYNRRSSSLESSSSSDSERKSPSASLRRFNAKQNRQQSENSFGYNARNSKVRRSRSLQLPEKRSPHVQASMTPLSSGQMWDQLPSDSYQGQTRQHFQQYAKPSKDHQKLRVSVNDEFTPTVAPPGDKSLRYFQNSTGGQQEKLAREAEEEVRIISDFLSGTRSRAAARNLLMHRYLNRPEDEDLTESEGIPSGPEYGVHFLGTNRRPRKKYQQRNEFPYEITDDNSNHSQKSNFWPHSVKPEKPSCFVPLNRNANIQSYPSQKKTERKEKKWKGESGKSINDVESKETNWKPELSQSDTRHSYSSPNQDQKSRKYQKQSCEKVRCQPEKSSCRKKKQNLYLDVKNGENEDREFYGSPAGENSLVTSSSSSSSLSTDVPYSAKIPNSQETSGGSSVSKFPVGSQNGKRLGDFSLPRPGSAPTNEGDAVSVDAQQRSLSLPKSFLSERYRYKQGKQSKFFPWKQIVRTPTTNVKPEQWPLASDFSKTAPATPIRDFGNAKDKGSLHKIQYPRSSSTPLLDEPSSSSYQWVDQNSVVSESSDNSNLNSRSSSIGSKETASSRISETLPESVLRKFKKSLSLRFSKAKGKYEENSTEDQGSLKEDLENIAEDVSKDNSSLGSVSHDLDAQSQDDNNEDQKFRFGSLVWRSSKERKKGKKAVRSSKCNSRDSGIQLENSLNLAEDSSESHDTDQQEDLETFLMLKQRGIYDKSTRPLPETTKQSSLNKNQADPNWRNQTKSHLNERGVKRTNSDLGGQGSFVWDLRNRQKRLLSISSPIRKRHFEKNSRKFGVWGPTTLKKNKRFLRGSQQPCSVQLRRSVSEPLGLNELLPLMRRRSVGVKAHALSEDEPDISQGTSDDEAISGSESSVASLNDRKNFLENEEIVILAEAVWDHVAMELDELPFRAGDVIEVLDTCDRNWWWGTTGENYGYFPSAFVRLRVSQEDTVEDCLAAMASGKQASKQIRRRTSISLLSNDQVRSSVVRELLNTERDFVRILSDVTEGYVAECKRRTDMFTSAQIATIFSNLEELLGFQKKFLNDLEERVDRDSPHKSCVGDTFLTHRSGFRMYSEYCNSHPMAIATLQELYQRPNYIKFFEACRLMRGLIEIPLDGYLLTPIQRICKYPLQLAELLKYTKPEHPDFEKVGKALEAMRGVATLINERKRKMESLEKLAVWQQRVEGWEGEDLVEISSCLIHQGDAVRVTSGMWTSNITLFLFDHQIIYCKKDLLKRNTYVYKGRICLDTSEIIDLPDGKDQQLGVTIRHGIKIHSCLRDKWLLFCCRSNEEKAKWLESLAEERKIVTQDRQAGLELPPAARQLAKMAAKSKSRAPSKPRSKNYKEDCQYRKVDMGANRSDVYRGKMGRKVGTWFTFGGGKKDSKVNLRPLESCQEVT